MDKRFLINISLLQIVPAIAVGILFAGIGMFLYLFLMSRKRIHLAMFVLATLGFVFVMSELLIVMFGMVFNNSSLSVHFHRLEQLCGAYFLFILPYFLYQYLNISTRINRISAYVAFSGLGIAFAMTLVAFIEPDLFISITDTRRPHWIIDVGGLQRGREGWVYIVRDLLLGIVILYCVFLLILAVIKRKSFRYITSILIGVAVGVYAAVEDIVHVYIGRHIDVFKNIEGARFPVGVSIFVLCSMISVFRRFVDQDNELKRAYKKLFESRQKTNLLNESLEKSLKEKEILLKEIHHRVKNNLQIVASLLYLQAERIDSSEIQQYFIESQSRIITMALIHEHLYAEETLGDINIESYLKELVLVIIETYKRNNDELTSTISVPQINIPLQAAVPLGLIVNELVTNSLLHGLAGRKEGHIDIELEKKDSTFQLVIRDNGKGLPEGFSLPRDGSLGLSLVSSLCSQLKGSLSMTNNEGAVATIRFRM
jgi:two-component sensor histidine kinase